MSTENDVYYCHGCDLGWTEDSPNRGWGSDCPRCGTRILSFRQLLESRGEDDGAQTVLTVILAGGVTTAAIFLKTIAEESAKDVYAFLKKKSWHRGAKDPRGRAIHRLLTFQEDNPDGIRIVDEQNRITLQLPSKIPDKALAELPEIIESAKPIDGSWVIISYTWGEWSVVTCHLTKLPRNNS